MLNDQKIGWIEIICGSMFSGKTEELIRRVKNMDFNNKKSKIFKPKLDIRFSEKEIVSHSKVAFPSISIKDASEIELIGSKYEIIAIDEAQFFDFNIVKICNKLANEGHKIIISGLDMDFQGNPFGPMPYLMATAEYVTKMHTLCNRSGRIANYSFRKSNNNEIIKIGGKNEYEPLSRIEFWKEIKK